MEKRQHLLPRILTLGLAVMIRRVEALECVARAVVAVKGMGDTGLLQCGFIIIHIFRGWIFVIVAEKAYDRTTDVARQIDRRWIALSHG